MDSFALIIFGITSNLAQTKLLPALYDITEKGLLPKNTSIIGIARGEKSQKQFTQEILDSLKKTKKKGLNKEIARKLVKKFTYFQGDANDFELYKKLQDKLKDLSSKGIECKNKIFYLATYPELYETILRNLKQSNLNKQTQGWTRLMIEKPIGNDLPSAKKLNKLLLQYFNEDQIYRLDHYLGKETLQNILTFRFNNGIFEHLMNNKNIDHIQITAAEEFGISGRGNYYDSVGALKDVGQNHILQMLELATMNRPQEFTDHAITQERIKLIKSLVPQEIVFGQYKGYKKEKNVIKNSKTDTFFSVKAEIANSRFKGVPIYIRAGKMLSRSVAEIAIIFKVQESRILKHKDWGREPNTLFYRVQPNEGVIIKILVKKPGHGVTIEPTYMRFCYRNLSSELTDPYERLIVDAIQGDQTFFNDAPEIEAQWKFTDLLSKSKQKVHVYKKGSWGPKEAEKLIQKDGRHWIEPSVAFCRF